MTCAVISRMLLKDEKNFLKLDNLAKTAIFIFIKIIWYR